MTAHYAPPTKTDIDKKPTDPRLARMFNWLVEPLASDPVTALVTFMLSTG